MRSLFNCGEAYLTGVVNKLTARFLRQSQIEAPPSSIKKLKILRISPIFLRQKTSLFLNIDAAHNVNYSGHKNFNGVKNGRDTKNFTGNQSQTRVA